MANRFLERLESGPPLVADGGMGVLVSSAAPRSRIPEEANLRAPETVVKLHVGFIQAGADVIETNTFGANRPKLAASYLEDELHAINSSAVKLAREAREISGRDVFIAGSIGPLGEAGRNVTPAERTAIFAEQAEVLEGRGVDLFAVETFFELDELEAAIGGVRSVSSLPILAMLTFDAGAETLSGLGAKKAAQRLASWAWPRSARTTARASRPHSPRSARWATTASARGDAEHRPREHGRQPDHLPARLARVLRRVRGARTHPRRPCDRRLLRHDADGDRSHRLGRQGGARAERPARVRRARSHRRRPRAARGDRPRAARSARTSGCCRCRSTPRSAAATPG